MVRRSVLAAFIFCALTASSQRPTIPQINADNTITFRYADKAASKVEVILDGVPNPLAMSRGDDGVWTLTTASLQPEIYGYLFRVDGVGTLDPQSNAVRPSYLYLSNTVTVPGTPPMPWELNAVPHGRVDMHRYTTHVVKHLPLDQSAYIVYTPPGYDAKRKGGYPVLYLLHGYSDGEDGWTAVGRAHFILDSLIAEGKAVPMIVAMPLGYGDMSFVNGGNPMWKDPANVDANVTLFSHALETEVMPMVEHEYNTAHGRENRAIAGLSMGGLESLYIGLNHTDEFAWIAGMSSAINQGSLNDHLPPLDAKKADLRLLWVACGTGDGLLKPNREFVAWAKEKGLPVTAVETPGTHAWFVWRDNLLHLAPLLFRGK